MPISYHCDRVKGITYVVWNGHTTIDDWRSTAQKQSQDPEWPAGDIYITDLRNVVLDISEFRSALESISDIYLKSNKLPHGLKHALLARSAFLLADAFQERMSANLIECIVFNDLETACTWLGVNVQEVDVALNRLRNR